MIFEIHWLSVRCVSDRRLTSNMVFVSIDLGPVNIYNGSHGSAKNHECTHFVFTEYIRRYNGLFMWAGLLKLRLNGDY